ncbi:hypothetical protein [Candidatus Marimicrobium litorale]|nr:hypothetical protein [Candidatus Marimicrobium litorale]
MKRLAGGVIVKACLWVSPNWGAAGLDFRAGYIKRLSINRTSGFAAS